MMQESAELVTTYLSVVAKDPVNPFVLVNVAEPGGNPESIASKVYSVPLASEDVMPIPLYEVPLWLTSMTLTPAGKLSVVDSDGSIHQYVRKRWTSRELVEGTFLNFIWSASDEDSFVAGDEGLLVHVRGDREVVTRDKKGRTFNSIHGLSGADVVAVGDEGALWSYDGTTWQELESPTNHSLLAVRCASPAERYIAGADGVIFRGTGERWKQLRCPKELTITSLAVHQGALYAAAGENGIYKLAGDALKPFSPLVTDTLSVAADRLFATRTGFMGYWTGEGWWGGDLNIAA